MSLCVDFIDNVSFAAPIVSGSAGTGPSDFINAGRWEDILAGPYIHTHTYAETEVTLSLGVGQDSWMVRSQIVQSVVNFSWAFVDFIGTGATVSAAYEPGSYAPAAVIRAPVEYEAIDGTPSLHIGYLTYDNQTIVIRSDAADGAFAAYETGTGRYRVKPGRTAWFFVDAP